jgi:hypothetical protein
MTRIVLFGLFDNNRVIERVQYAATSFADRLPDAAGFLRIGFWMVCPCRLMTVFPHLYYGASGDDPAEDTASPTRKNSVPPSG